MPLRTGARGRVLARPAIITAGGYTPAQETEGGTYAVVWLDFSDPQSMTKNSNGTGGNPSVTGDTIGRIYNKADPSYVGGSSPSGSYLYAFNVLETWNSAGYMVGDTNNDQGSYQSVGSYINDMFSGNTVGYTGGVTGSTSDVTISSAFMVGTSNTSREVLNMGTFGTQWRLSNWEGIDLRVDNTGSSSVIHAHVGVIDKIGNTGTWYKDGTSIGVDTTSTPITDATGAGRFDINFNANPVTTLHIYQVFFTNRPMTNLTNLTAFLKEKGGIS